MATLIMGVVPNYENCGIKDCERFEPRSHFISRLSMIARVNVVLNLLLTVTDVSTTCAPVSFRVKVSCITSVDGLHLPV